MDVKERVATELVTVRNRSLDLLAPLAEADLTRQHSPLMSPLVWDLAHVGNYEDLWLLRAIGHEGVGPDLDDLYDAFKHPRPDRPSLPILSPAAARAYIAEVRGRVLDGLESADLDQNGAPLLDRGFVYGMVVQHEHQHDETMLATLQLMGEPGYHDHRPSELSFGSRAAAGPAAAFEPEVLVPGGPFVMGTDDDPWAYDNERPAHVVDVASFLIDTTPVTNAAYTEFVDAGGYQERRWWSPEGWAWRVENDARHPEFWRGEGPGTWARLRFGKWEDLPLGEPVQHVCWYEADAYARFRGRRLPTEAEWEKAASWNHATGTKGRYPWGDGPPGPDEVNLGQRRFGPAPVGSYPAGAAPCGALGLLGEVWEWTASDFRAYPGFRSFPYREYSEVFYGSKFKVLRGGSWATHPTAIRTTFRNWDYPIRRQIFAGFRTARDV